MARNAEGWKLKEKRGLFHVRFTHKGIRYEVSTRSRDATEAATAAARIYADVVSGQVKRAHTGKLAHPAMDLNLLTAEWLTNIASELKGKTPDTYLVYARTWKATFDTLGNINSSSIGDYQRTRLTQVKKTTVVKERSALLRFLVWLVEKGYLLDVPLFPRIGKKVQGTPYKEKRRVAPDSALTASQVSTFLAGLAMRSDKHGFVIRPRFQFAYATALRPGLLDNLTWDDVLPDGRLRIRPEFDKESKKRKVRLSPMALAALKEAGPPVKGGLIFGRHDYREHIREAKKLLPSHVAEEFTPYGLKHARVTEWFRQGHTEGGIQKLTGTKYALDRYVKPSDEDADRITEKD